MPHDLTALRLLPGDDLRPALEITSLSGSLSPDGAHLHAVVSGSDGRVLGGHVAPGCIVRTTAEILVARLDGVRFSREPDPATGYAELRIHPTA